MSRQATIAIVGRPNVGKSTLFNRMVGRRVALVSDLPGLTRDRREGTADLDGLTVTVVDTAGLEDAGRDTIPDRMRVQSEIAVETADLVLFVLDARVGVTEADRLFADAVRRAGRPVLLVANKCEGHKQQEGLYEAYELGLGDPIAISAEHGEGLGELYEQAHAAVLQARPDLVEPDVADDDAAGAADELAAEADEADEADEASARDRPIRLAIVGRPNAGKSTLVNALLGEDRMITGPEPGLTRDSIASPFVWQGQGRAQGRVQAFELYDTAGLRRRSRIEERAEKLSAGDALKAIRFAEIVVMLVDAECPLEHQDLTIAQHVVEEGRALVIGVNKWDLVTEKQKQLASIRQTVADKLAQVPGVPVVPVSALAEQGLDKLMAAILGVYETWNKRVATPDLNRWLGEAVARHAPPAVSGRRIKIRYMTQPSARPPTFVAFASQPQALPKSYERYLLNSLRETFGLPGVPIRLSFRKGANPYASKD